MEELLVMDCRLGLEPNQVVRAPSFGWAIYNVRCAVDYLLQGKTFDERLDNSPTRLWPL